MNFDEIDIDIDINKYFETSIDNVKTHYDITNNNNMCTGISYYAALHLDKLIYYFINNSNVNS